jgi:2-dehydro-3-deoxy-D-arabinonate dehydratase
VSLRVGNPDRLAWARRPLPSRDFLLTGTGIVPETPFTLHKGDLVEIKIAGIGTLLNPIVQG